MPEKNAYVLYWRLNIDYGDGNSISVDKLRAQGYEIDSKKMKTTDLLKLLRRQDRGLLRYEKCSNAELEKITTARKVASIQANVNFEKPEKWSKLQRELTIQALTEEDEKLCFDKFLDLPPELRTRVYHFYSAEFPHALTLPTKPPLARTCHQLRQEVLPVFYSTHEFKICLARTQSNGVVFRPMDDTYFWLSQLSSADVSNINELQVYVSDRLLNRKSVARTGLAGSIKIELSSDNDRPSCIVQRTSVFNADPSWNNERRERVRIHLQEQLLAIGLSGQRRRFDVQDIWNLRKAISAAYD